MPPPVSNDQMPQKAGQASISTIETCVIDVVTIAQQSQDFDQAKKRIEQLFADTQHLIGKHFAIAQRVRDQLVKPDNEASGNCKRFLDQVMEWLDRDHLARHHEHFQRRQVQ
jgi:hypothetical protein